MKGMNDDTTWYIPKYKNRKCNPVCTNSYRIQRKGNDMGGSVSAGVDNDHLIDNLRDANYIRTPLVEKVLRTVDRAFYFLPEFRYSAYRDLAWKHENLHLSAPCIYSEVLEQLQLEPGHSFLNIGSGTGYLSTMAGLILGPYGINHGIEVQSDVVDYAYDRLEQFKQTCCGIDVFEFCEPYFVVGNGFDLSNERKYDRIYCGAACPQTQHEHIKKHLKVNGILIVPYEEDLLKIERVSESVYEVASVMSVSFSTLQSPNKLCRTISIPDPQPQRLQELCRSKIRCILREIVEKENPSLLLKPKRRRAKSEGHRQLCSRVGIRHDLNGGSGHFENGNVIFHNHSSIMFRDFMRNLRRESAAEEEEDVIIFDTDHEVTALIEDDSENESSEPEPEEELDSNSNTPQGNVANDNVGDGILMSRFVGNDGNLDEVEFGSNDDDDDEDVEEDEPTNEIDLERNRTEISGHTYHRLPTVDIPIASHYSPRAETHVDVEEQQPHSSSESNQKIRKKEERSVKQPKKVMKREKLDSGISEESDDGKVSRSYESSFSESTYFSEPTEMESEDSESNESNEDQSDDNTMKNEMEPEVESISFKYRQLIEKKIQALELPQRIKIYLNHERPFKVESC